MAMAAVDGLYGSDDFTQYGLRGVPKSTTTTVLGKTKTLARLYGIEILFLVVANFGILGAMGLTVYSLIHLVQTDPNSQDLTLTMLVLLNAGFCIFYVIHGVFRERVFELYSFMVAILVVLCYCILEYVLHSDRRTLVKLIRVILISVAGPVNIILAILVARKFGYLQFKIAGASQYLQRLYKQAAFFSCLLKFHLQVAASVILLVLKDGVHITLGETITLAAGGPCILAWTILGWLVLRKELKSMTFVFAATGLVIPMYYLFKIITEYHNLMGDDGSTSEQAVYILAIAVFVGLVVWMILMVELVLVYKNFDKGLRDRAQLIAHENTGLLAATRTRRMPST